MLLSYYISDFRLKGFETPKLSNSLYVMAPFEQKLARIVKSRLSLVYLSQSQA